MLMLISPAKTLDFDSGYSTKIRTKPRNLDDSAELITDLKKLAPQDISELMSISDKLGALNYDRFQQWAPPFTKANAKPAVLAFKGDVYTGMQADTFSEDELKFAQQHLRILSGLYGLLRPMDLIQPYRLEMGTKFANPRGKNLYEFWQDIVTPLVNKDLKASGSETLLNLASNEYFNAVKTKEIRGAVITPVFKDMKNGKYKIISFFAKKARGMMAAYVIQNGIQHVKDIKAFNVDDYVFNAALSEGNQWVFTRG